MSEKIYCLGKLLPGGHRHRKNTADMLEEAKKYLKFLQAQVNSLRTMPTESRFTEVKLGLFGDLRGMGELGNLSRQQLLQVVVNSPAAQMVMADRGRCLATAEQVAMMKRIEARQKVIQQFMHNLPL
ncbi:transcription factor bHLH117-like [Chenopodium quinoa]|uniref:transcription factor bHLH117-like n=1 Tax=Chenopodium quinoa TaxID=63459 RepID=UPI000B7801A2|nr:transcription factor bHLH117-like [Chenopodium quinoa]